MKKLLLALLLFGIATQSTFAADCNGNGSVDSCDISCSNTGCASVQNCGRSNDCNSNGIPDECESFLPVPIKSVQVSTIRAVDVSAPEGDSRLWLVQQDGRIRILINGVATLYLNLSTLVGTNTEQGLLGIAFDPNFSTNGYFYVAYSDITSGAMIIARYTSSGGNPASNTADPSSRVILKTIPHPDGPIHNGGCLEFGPDGFLYYGSGDGGGTSNGGDRSQMPSSLLGKMLRLDVNNPPTYIPASNPYVGAGDPLDEIWSFGLRNPWRFSFDPLTGDMYIADVGAGSHEEIDIEPSGVSGRNYGWPCMEGTGCTSFVSTCVCNNSNLTLPVLDLPHSSGFCAVIGGYVYRGCAIPSLQRTYFYSDLCSGPIKSFRYSPITGISNHLDRTIELSPSVGLRSVVSFGEDGFGELYFCTADGVFKIVPDNSAPAVCGNNIIESGEQCDDGNITDGDGCSSLCVTEQLGACCVGTDCNITTSAGCTLMGGTYNGNGTSCLVNSCSPITGACCVGTNCSVTTSSGCSGTYMGDNSSCSAGVCNSTVGACCSATVCSLTTQSNCSGTGQIFHGNGTSCSGISCGVVSPIPCSDIRRLKIGCTRSGVQVMVVFLNEAYNGQTVTVSVNNNLLTLPIVGKYAIGTIGMTGSATAVLVNPPNCSNIMAVSTVCP